MCTVQIINSGLHGTKWPSSNPSVCYLITWVKLGHFFLLTNQLNMLSIQVFYTVLYLRQKVRKARQATDRHSAKVTVFIGRIQVRRRWMIYIAGPSYETLAITSRVHNICKVDKWGQDDFWKMCSSSLLFWYCISSREFLLQFMSIVLLS